jgi:putative hydrolase of the HAD superfamily
MQERYHSWLINSLDETSVIFHNERGEQMAQGSAVRPSGFRGLILDYGEVLCLRPMPEQIERMAAIFGISADHFMKLYERNRREYDRGDLSAERYWFSWADESGLRLRADQIPLLRDWDVEMWSNTDPRMIDWLKAVRLSGVRTALLSNMQNDMITRVRNSFSWISHFDCLVFSYEKRLAKPEAAIYERCLEELGTPPDQTLFVDDREVNVRAARDFGIQGIRFESVRQLRAELGELRFPILPALSSQPPA